MYYITYLITYFSFLGRSLYKKTKEEDDSLKIRQLTGKEMKKLFTKIKLKILFPNLNMIKEKQFLWKEFFDIYKLITSDNLMELKPDRTHILDTSHKTYNDDNILFEIQNRTSYWLKIFIIIYHKNVTPYMHIFQGHIHQIIEKHGSLRPYSQQGAEKFNDIVTLNYFRSTNRNKEDFLNQLVKKANRVELLRLNDDRFIDDE